MLALASKTRTYSVLPDRRHARAPVPRHARRRPIARALAVMVMLVLPAVLYVSEQTRAARAGYVILKLRQDIAAVEADHARLVAAVTAFQSPDRIERIATSALGMVPPHPQQFATLTVAPSPLAMQDAPSRSVWDRLSAWLGKSEAEAGEPPR